MLRFTIYAIMFGAWVGTLVYDVLYIPVLRGTSYFAKFVFLTQIDFATCCLFWGLWSIDRELVFPKALDKFIPKWHNHMLHTAPVAFLLVDTLLTCHHMPTRRTGSTVFGSFIVFYFAILTVCRVVQGQWLYPIFDVLPLYGQIGFMLAAGVVAWLLYILGDILNNAVWGTASHVEAKVESQGPRRYSAKGSKKQMNRID